VAKLPYLPLYTGDWLKDSALTRCTPAARGVWIDLLCVMHDDDRSGELRGTIDEIARLARVKPDELSHALTDIQNKRAAEVVQRGDEVYIRNRRMYRESQKRKSNAERQERHRKQCRNGEGNAGVAFEDEIDIDSYFESFWKEFPSGRRGSKGKAREAFFKAIVKVKAQTIIDAAIEYAASEVGRGQFVKMPATWLNQECWDDDRESWRERRPVKLQHVPVSQRGKT
jgi:hypothetical protein